MSKRAVELRGYEGDLEALVDEAVLGDELVITRDGEPVAEIIPLRRSKPRERGLAKGMIIIPPSFDDRLEGFEEYE